MSRAIDKIFKAVNVLMVAMLAGMVLLVFFNVILRYFFNSGITWSEELARYLFVWTVYIGAIGAMRDNEHLGVDTVIRRLPAKIKLVSYVLGQVIIFAIMIILLIGSYKLTALNINAKAAATGISLVFIYGIGILTSACIALNVIVNIQRALTEPGALEKLTTMHESEEDPIADEAEDISKEEGK